jgi:hypothetical protein
MRLRQHVEDFCTDRYQQHLESRVSRGCALNAYEWRLLRALRGGMRFVQADLWARHKSLTPEEMELLDHLSRGFDSLVAVIRRLEAIDALNPRQSVIYAAIELGIVDVYHLHLYLKLFAPPLIAEAA